MLSRRDHQAALVEVEPASGRGDPGGELAVGAADLVSQAKARGVRGHAREREAHGELVEHAQLAEVLDLVLAHDRPHAVPEELGGRKALRLEIGEAAIDADIQVRRVGHVADGVEEGPGDLEGFLVGHVRHPGGGRGPIYRKTM